MKELEDFFVDTTLGDEKRPTSVRRRSQLRLSQWLKSKPDNIIRQCQSESQVKKILQPTRHIADTVASIRPTLLRRS